MGSKSYVDGWQYSAADSEVFAKFPGCPDSKKCPHAYRWYVHIAAITGVRGLSVGASAAGKAAPAKAAPAKGGKKDKKDKKDKKAAKKAAPADDDDDFDVFGDDDEEEADDKPKETRAEMLERLKKEANDRLIAKAAKQRTLVSIEVKPWGTEQDLNELWKKITTEIKQDGVKWGEVSSAVENRAELASLRFVAHCLTNSLEPPLAPKPETPHTCCSELPFGRSCLRHQKDLHVFHYGRQQLV